MNSLQSHLNNPRQATLSDLDALVNLESELFSYDQINRRSFKNFINSDNDVWIYELNQKIVGYVLVLKRKGSNRQRMYSLAISPKCQGQGIGRLLINHVIHQAHGAKDLRLEVKVDNIGAIKLYESLGFVQKKRVSEFYSDGTDAYIYQKEL